MLRLGFGPPSVTKSGFTPVTHAVPSSGGDC